jgi:hypothetical protein
MVVVAFFAANADAADVTTIKSTLRRTKSAASSGRRSFFCSANRYSKNDILCLNPSQLAQLLSERIHKHRTSRGSATIQETNPEDFSRLLRVDQRPTECEGESDCEDPQPFWILDCRFWIIGRRTRKSERNLFIHAPFS